MSDRVAVTWSAYRAMELLTAGELIDAVVVDTDDLASDSAQLRDLADLKEHLPVIALSTDPKLLDEDLAGEPTAALRRVLSRLNLVGWLLAPGDRDDWGLPPRNRSHARNVATLWSQLLVDLELAPWVENRWHATVPTDNEELAFLDALAEQAPVKLVLNVTHLLLDAARQGVGTELLLQSLRRIEIVALRLTGIDQNPAAPLGPHASLIADARFEVAVEAVGAHTVGPLWILIDCASADPIDAVLDVARRARAALDRGRLRRAEGNRW